MQILNTATTAVTTDINRKRLAAYLTDATHNLQPAPAIVSKHGRHTTVDIAPRSLTTLTGVSR